MKHLFDLDLQYRPGMAAVTASKGKAGKLLGSGDGAIAGPEIQGTVRWSLFETQSESACETNLSGLIETADGTQIQFESTGFGLRPDTSQPNRWSLAAAVRFGTDEKRYQWLNTALAVWEGGFDMNTGRHHYRAYTRADETSD